MKGLFDKIIANKITINLNVFSVLMKNIIVGNLNDTTIITVIFVAFD